MTAEEMLAQVLQAMNEQTEMLTKIIDKKISETEIRLDNKIDDAEARINIKIENEVCKRIDSLFDGYKLCHEQQWELERRVRRIEERLDIAI